MGKDISAFRWMAFLTTDRLSAPTDGIGGSVPDFTLSPVAVSGMPTTGMLLMLKLPTGSAAAPDAGGYDVKLWMRDPVSYLWAAADTVAIGYGELFTTFDFDAGDIYFQVGAVDVDGNVFLGVAEQ